MKRERKNVILSMFVNLITAMLKIVTGLIFNNYTIMTSGYYTLCNFSQEFMCETSSIYRKRRANRKYPFGYGNIEYIAYIIIGVIFVLIAMYIFIKSLRLQYSQVDFKIIFSLIAIILIQFINASYLLQVGKEIRSQMLFSSAHSSYYDAVQMIIGSLIIILTIFISFFDFLGCIIITISILKKGINIIKDNYILIKGQNDKNKTITDKIKKVIKTIDKIKYSETNLVNIKDFYYITIEIGIDDDLSICELIKKENELKNKIYKERLKIKYIDFEIIKN